MENDLLTILVLLLLAGGLFCTLRGARLSLVFYVLLWPPTDDRLYYAYACNIALALTLACECRYAVAAAVSFSVRECWSIEACEPNGFTYGTLGLFCLTAAPLVNG